MSIWKRIFGKGDDKGLAVPSSPSCPDPTAPSPSSSTPLSELPPIDATHYSKINDRVIRVFISSTFRDMQKERDILIKRIFPQLRKRCEERGVTWTEVDLRWGITDEQSAEGKVLPLCLAEIAGCRPYFIGLLGERYGWLPKSIDPTLENEQPWIKEHHEKSVTELEILHGVLNEPKMADHAFFYFRDAAYLNQVDEGKRTDYESESQEAAAKLKRLKHRIRANYSAGKLLYPPREDYLNPEALGEMVLTDFTGLIDNLYPADQIPNPLDQEAIRHEAYARSRRLAFIGREDLLCRLNKNVSTGGMPLVLTGESGCGKSALISEWVSLWRKDQPDDLIIQHYIGSTPENADWQGLVRRILGELKRAFEITDDIPVQSEVLRDAFNNWTLKAVGSRQIVIVIDALNQLAEGGAARQLGWLPVSFPPNFHIIVSSLSGECLDALKKRDWVELQVPLFGRTNIAPASLAYFKIFCKTPSEKILHQLESTPAARNALFLRAVLDELRQFGKYEELEVKATEYLSAPDLPELFDRIITRWHEDFGKYSDCPDLVRRSLSLIACSRFGLSEAELLDILGDKRKYIEGQITYVDFSSHPLGTNMYFSTKEPVPRAKWTPLYLAVENAMSIRSGLLDFGHDHLRTAVKKRFLADSEFEKFNHSAIARYFWDIEACPRSVDELPYQLICNCEWPDLTIALVNPNLFHEACRIGKQIELMKYWQKLKELASQDDLLIPGGMTIDIPDLYRQSFAQLTDESKLQLSWQIGQFLLEMGYSDAAKNYFDAEVQLVQSVIGDEALNTDPCIIARNSNDQGLVLLDKGDVVGALDVFEKAELVLSGHSSDKEVRRCLASIFLNKAKALRMLNEVNRSQILLEDALTLMKEACGERSVEVATVMQTIGNNLAFKEDPKGSLHWHRQAYLIRKEQLGNDHRDTALSLANIANPLLALNQFYRASQALFKSAEIFKSILGDEHDFTKTVKKSLHQNYEIRAQGAENTKAPLGLILLILESQPSKEMPPNPATEEGRKVIAQAITEDLINVWDDIVTNGSLLPVMIISFPEFEEAVSQALASSVANHFKEGLLQWVKITRLDDQPNVEDVETSLNALFPLFEVLNQVLTWVEGNQLQSVMVKPVANRGAIFKRMYLNWILKKQNADHAKLQADGPNTEQPVNEDIRPLMIEIIPFDGLDGPLTGIYTGAAKPRPFVMPSSSWHEQKYKPQLGDNRATGTFYLNLPALHNCFVKGTAENISPLQDWAMEQLLSIAMSNRSQQCDIFENALFKLMLVLMSGQINFDKERGMRGFRAIIPVEFEGLPI
ncbi:MAG: DUF4062 domain-containing protein [Desulfuromonadaceae bacterium]|nr:DUF4062 domain-containing protein [Desulfuromonadaceae bacterium]